MGSEKRNNIIKMDLKPKINYSNLTVEQIEEYVEFIDWSKISKELFTDEIKQKFGSFPQVRLRIWFEDLLDKIQIPNKHEKFIINVFYCKDNEGYLEFDKKSRQLFCSKQKVWKEFEKIFPGANSTMIKNYVRRLYIIKSQESDELCRLLRPAVINGNWLPTKRDYALSSFISEEFLYYFNKLNLCIL